MRPGQSGPGTSARGNRHGLNGRCMGGSQAACGCAPGLGSPEWPRRTTWWPGCGLWWSSLVVEDEDELREVTNLLSHGQHLVRQVRLAHVEQRPAGHRRVPHPDWARFTVHRRLRVPSRHGDWFVDAVVTADPR